MRDGEPRTPFASHLNAEIIQVVIVYHYVQGAPSSFTQPLNFGRLFHDTAPGH